MWFDVDKAGLAKLLERRGKSYVLLELVSNALDTEAKTIHVVTEPIPGRPFIRLDVEDDDPDGFKNLTHAWTLFAESARKGDTTKRGRFNLGEKLVLALCEEATIFTTTGTVEFSSAGRQRRRAKRESGSLFRGIIRMTREELEEALEKIRSIIVPPDRVLTVNGDRLPSREATRTFTLGLQTEVADSEGLLKRSFRKTTVGAYVPREGEVPMLYELGIPVVELPDGDPFHIDVGQKVPLNMDRDNVTPAYLRELRVAVLNEMHDRLEKAQVEAPWARVAMSDERCTDEAARTVTRLRFGEKAVAHDLSDPEGTKMAVAQGYTVVPGGALSREEWSVAKRAGLLLPAGKVTPSPKAYSTDPNAPPVTVVEPTGLQVPVVAHIARLGTLMLARCGAEVALAIRIVHTTNGFAAAYGPGAPLDLNLRALGKGWFVTVAEGRMTAMHKLLIHELGHHFSGDHLSSAFHDALCALGAALAAIALENPGALRCDVPEAMLEIRAGVKGDRS